MVTVGEQAKRRFRHGRRHLAVAGLLAVALLASACSGSTTSGAAAAEFEGSDEPGPGVTADTVKIGFTILDSASLEAALKIEFPDQGDQEAQIAALVEWINGNGGIGGRQVEPVVRTFEALFDTAESEEKLCNEFTQDDEVFAVMMWGMFQENLRPCFAANDTVMLEHTLYPLPEQTMRDLAPYYMAPNFATYEDIIRGLGGVFEETGFLDGGTVGVIGVDSEANRAIYEDQLGPMLDEAGTPAVAVRWIDLKDSANTRAGYEQAIIAYKAAGVDRLITLGGSRLLSFFLDFATKQDFAPRLVLTSYDNVDFNNINYPEEMADAVGLSASPSWDFVESQLASPANDEEAKCAQVLIDAGIEPGGRENARNGQFYCDGLLFLAAAAEQAGMDSGTPMNAANLYQGALDLGDTWSSGQNYSTLFDGVVAGAAGYQSWVMNPGTGELELVGEPREFE